jgi:hypothetical protein
VPAVLSGRQRRILESAIDVRHFLGSEVSVTRWTANPPPSRLRLSLRTLDDPSGCAETDGDDVLGPVRNERNLSCAVLDRRSPAVHLG